MLKWSPNIVKCYVSPSKWQPQNIAGFPLLLAVLRVHCSSLASLALEAPTRITPAEVVCNCLPYTLKKMCLSLYC